MINIKKIILTFSILVLGLNAANYDNDIINFEKKRLSNNARVEIIDVKINSKQRMKAPINNWYGYLIDVKAKVKDKEINAKDIVFSNGIIVTSELMDLKTGKSLKDLLQPKLSSKYHKEDHLIAGNHKAKDKIVVFSDPLCPFCIDYIPDVIEHVNKNKDDIALYYYHFPLLKVHPASATLVKAMDVAKHKGIKDIENRVYKTDWEQYFKADSTDEEAILNAFNKEFKTQITKEELNDASIMGKILADLKEAETRQHTPKIAFVAPKSDFTTSSGKEVKADEIDLHVRALSMQKLHHAMMGTASVAIGVAACIPGTLVNLAAGGGEKSAVEFGHPSGTLKVGAVIKNENGKVVVDKATMSRSARIIMEGYVHVPAGTME